MLFSTPPKTTLHHCIVTLMFLAAKPSTPYQLCNAPGSKARCTLRRGKNWAALKQAGGEQGAALRHLHTLEGDLFGLASDGKNSKQSWVQIQTDLQGTTLKQPRRRRCNRWSYLLGARIVSFLGRGRAAPIPSKAASSPVLLHFQTGHARGRHRRVEARNQPPLP